MRYLPEALCLLVGVSGWFYAFYSQAAGKLRGIEHDDINARRVRLRRAGGVAMLVLAVLMYVGIKGVDFEASPQAYLGVWACVMLTMMVIVLLGLLDLRFTSQLRRRLKESSSSENQS